MVSLDRGCYRPVAHAAGPHLRRVFERLILSRFNEFKVQEGWNEDEFKAMRMERKIDRLKGHLPEFLVENRKVYSILSSWGS